MKLLHLFSLCPIVLMGCVSTTETYNSPDATNVPIFSYKFCPQNGDVIQDSMIANSLRSAMYRESSFAPVRRVDGTSDVHIYKGLRIDIQDNQFKAAYLHRHSTEMDRTRNVDIDSYFQAVSMYQISKIDACSEFKFNAPLSYDIKTRRTIILTEVEQLGTPEMLEKDLLNSLKKAQPRIEFARTYNHKATQNFSSLAPRDLSTTLQIKHQINAKKYEDKYIAKTNLKLPDGYVAELNMDILPYKNGSVVQYSAEIMYKNEYFGNGTSSVLSQDDYKKFGSFLDKFIANMDEN